MKAVAYLRVSTASQAEEGVSLEAQEARIRAWALAMDAQIVGVYRDMGISGSRADNRPGLQAAIEQACKVKAALVVYSLSRLCRSTRDAINIAERLDKSGADLVSLSEKIDTTSASGRMIFRMLAVLAEFERDQIAERTRAALAHKRAKGEVTGAIPFGFEVAEDGTRIRPVRSEQVTLQLIQRLLAEGRSQRQVVSDLNQQGLLTKQGKAWNRNSLRSVLRTQASRERLFQSVA